jgi:hypothetical protein
LLIESITNRIINRQSRINQQPAIEIQQLSDRDRQRRGQACGYDARAQSRRHAQQPAPIHRRAPSRSGLSAVRRNHRDRCGSW